MKIQDPQIKDKVSLLLESGAARPTISQSLDLTDSQTHDLIACLKVEKALEAHPGLLKEVQRLIDEGETPYCIHKVTGLSLEAVEVLIKRADSQTVDDELKLEEEPALAAAASREARKKQRRGEISSVARLVEQGHGTARIAKETGLTPETAQRHATEGRLVNFATAKMQSKAEKIAKIEHILDDGGSIFQVARAFDTAPGSAAKLIKKVTGTSVVADEILRTALSKGTSLKALINRYGLKNIQEAREVIADLFPGYLTYEKQLPDDVYFTVIPDKSDHFGWLNSNKNPKRFKYCIGEENNYLFIQFDPDVTDVKIFNFTDTHVGHKNFDRQRFINDVAMVEDDSNAFVVIGGDLIEAATKLSVGDPWEANMRPQEQSMEAAKLLMPIAHKLLAYRSGNHDAGRFKHTSTDMAEVIAHYLQVPYFKVETVIDLQLQQQLFTVLLDHGHSGGSIQAILKDAEKFHEFAAFFVHAHFSGHVHNSQIIERVMKQKVVGKGLEFQRSFTVVGGSHLRYTKTYAEESKFSPAPQDLTFMEFHSSGQYFPGRVRDNGQ